MQAPDLAARERFLIEQNANAQPPEGFSRKGGSRKAHRDPPPSAEGASSTPADGTTKWPMTPKEEAAAAAKAAVVAAAHNTGDSDSPSDVARADRAHGKQPVSRSLHADDGVAAGAGPAPGMPHTTNPQPGGKSSFMRSTLPPAHTRPLPHPSLPPLKPGERDLYCYEKLTLELTLGKLLEPPLPHAGGWAKGVPFPFAKPEARGVHPKPPPLTIEKSGSNGTLAGPPSSARSRKSTGTGKRRRSGGFGGGAGGEGDGEEEWDGEEDEGEEEEYDDEGRDEDGEYGLSPDPYGGNTQVGGEGEAASSSTDTAPPPPDDHGMVGGQLSEKQRKNLLDAVIRVCPRAVAALPLPRERSHEGAARRRQQQAAAREAAARGLLDQAGDAPPSRSLKGGGSATSPAMSSPAVLTSPDAAHGAPSSSKRPRFDMADSHLSPVAASPHDAEAWPSTLPHSPSQPSQHEDAVADGTPSSAHHEVAWLLQLSSGGR